MPPPWRAGPPPSVAPDGWSCRARSRFPTACASCPSCRRPKPPDAPHGGAEPPNARLPAMRVGVIGGGLMGSGIAEVCARSGVDVTVVEIDDERAERARAAIDRSLGRGVRSGKLSEDEKATALDHLAVTTTLEDIEGVDAAIE